jgi:hypothetical protein
MITLISSGCNILTMELTEPVSKNFIFRDLMSLTAGGFFPYCDLNIRCTVTENFVSANHRTRWTFSCTEATFKENQQHRS